MSIINPFLIMTASNQRIPIKLLLGIGFGMFLGVLSANSIPVMIGSLLDGLAITEAEVGVLGTVELLAVAVAALAATPLAGMRAIAGAGLGLAYAAAAMAAGTISLTFAFGPACGGFIATWFSYAAIGWFSCALCLLAALAFILVKPADTTPQHIG